MLAFEKQDEMAEKILTKHRGKVLAIVKATRAGATTNLLKQACELEQKTVIVAPYIEIFDTTIDDVKRLVRKKEPRIDRIAGNEEMCRRIADRIAENERLKNMVFHLRPSCVNCEYNDPECCKLQKILAGEWDILGLTYAKLKALSIGESATATDLLEKIKMPDNLILDEFVTGIVDSFPSFEIEEPHAYLQQEFDYQRLWLNKFGKDSFQVTFWAALGNLALAAEVEGKNLPEGGKKVFDSPIRDDVETFFKDNFAKCWNLIERLTLERKQTKVLQQLVQIASSERFFIMKKRGKISIKPVLDINDISRGSVYIKNSVRDFFEEGKLVALVDACLPDLDLERSLGLKVETLTWGDPLNTNQSQLVICDTRKIGETDFSKSMKPQAELKETINALSKLHGANTILLATQNIKMWKVIETWRKGGAIPKDIMTTYYRSDISRGVTPDPMRRILILIGAPHLPKEAYLPETYISAGQDKDLQIAYKKSDMKSAFINLIGRVKDPKGKESSIVYALGIKADEIRALIPQGRVVPPFVVKFPVQGVDSEDFARAAHLFLNVKRDRWKNLEEDLPVLERMVRKCHECDKVNCGEIIPNQTEKVQRIAKEYSDILEHYNIKTVTATRGLSLVCLKS